MRTVKEVFDYLNAKAPVELKMDFDNVGLLVGDEGWKIDRILLSLDITPEVIDEAIKTGAGIIVSHHPLFFSLKSVSTMNSTGARAVKMLENRIAGICMHTNLDAVQEGVNDALAIKLGLENISALHEGGIDKNGSFYGIGRIGTLSEPMPMQSFLKTVKERLNGNGLRYHDSGRPVSRVAVGGGSCGDFMELAISKGCDTFVTADLKYDAFLDAKRMGLNLIDADHFCTENVVIPVLERWLKEEFEDMHIEVSKVHSQTVQFF